jgi:hypothetical protein
VTVPGEILEESAADIAGGNHEVRNGPARVERQCFGSTGLAGDVSTGGELSSRQRGEDSQVLDFRVPAFSTFYPTHPTFVP